MKCWLCEQDGFAPGEIKLDMFGDPQCIYCDALLGITVTHLHMVDAFQQNMQRTVGESSQSQAVSTPEVLSTKSVGHTPTQPPLM